MKVSRREWLQLGLFVLGGAAVGLVLRGFAPPGQDLSANETARRLLLDRTSPQEGPPDADLTVVIFTDYQCPACKLAAPELAAAIKADGRVRVVYRDYPVFGERSERAARVALAAARQGIYSAVHHRLMAERRRLDDAVLQETVERSGGDWPRILADLDRKGEAIERAIGRTRMDAFTLAVAGTPTYLIGRFLVAGFRSREEFIKAFGQARSP